jgi:hypothetical protein
MSWVTDKNRPLGVGCDAGPPKLKDGGDGSRASCLNPAVHSLRNALVHWLLKERLLMKWRIFFLLPAMTKLQYSR